MSKSQAERAAKIDAMMEQASKALVSRDYFTAERTALSALRRAHHDSDYDRMARILLPLQEARRQKREMALEARRIVQVDEAVPEGKQLTAGCYLVAPPRVGADGRMLREIADERQIPVYVLVREPASREGLWPIVAVGPVTVRAKVEPPPPPPPPEPVRESAPKKAPAKGGTKTPPAKVAPAPSLPMSWFVRAGEALGDEAISQVPATLVAAARVDALMDRLEALPHHEKLHQRLEEACREALQEPPRKKKPGLYEPFEGDEFDLEVSSEE